MYLLCRLYFASMFSSFVMAALYVTGITRSVLTWSTYFSLVFSYLLVIACLYVTLYYVNVS